MANNTIYVPPKYIKSSGPDLQQDGVDLDPIPLINFTDGFTINHEPQYPRYTLSVNNQFLNHQFASGALNSILTTKTGSVNSDLIVTTGRTSTNDGGGGVFYWVTGSSATADEALVYGNTVYGRWFRRIDSGAYNVKWFGAKGDNSTNDTNAVTTALIGIPSGYTLFFPKGIYKILRGNGSVLSANITQNITITGEGKDTILRGLPATGILLDDPYNENYNIFQANSVSVTINNIAFDGNLAPLYATDCPQIIIDNCYDNGLLVNASSYLRDKSFIFKSCDNVIVNGLFATDCNFPIYFSGVDETDRCGKGIVTNSIFKHTQPTGSYTATFPAQVYIYHADSVIVNNCQFTDIYSSVNSGDLGSGMGFSVYEGDGSCGSLTVTNNNIVLNGKGSKRSTGIYCWAAESVAINNNNILAATSSNVYAGIICMSYTSGTYASRTITGNSLNNIDNTGRGIWGYGVGTATELLQPGNIIISNNSVNGFSNGIEISGLSEHKISINNNIVNKSAYYGIVINGIDYYPQKHPQIVSNVISGSGYNAIACTQYVASPNISDNLMIDGNTSGQTGVLGAAILLASNTYGSVLKNNKIQNTVYQTGFTKGIANGTSITSRNLKDITFGNTFIGFADADRWDEFPTSTPIYGAIDICKGDFVENTSLDSGEPTGWYCVVTYYKSLTANTNHGTTTVTVASTTGLAVGDVVCLTRYANPWYQNRWYLTSETFITTIASITDATHFELASATPGATGDYDFYYTTAVCRIARFKAGPVIS